VDLPTQDCLTNEEQMGEGWSDFFLTGNDPKSSDKGTDKRGIGTYAIDEANDGDGITKLPVQYFYVYKSSNL
jgi:extracellular elastinolytic metalloproteinase